MVCRTGAGGGLKYLEIVGFESPCHENCDFSVKSPFWWPWARLGSSFGVTGSHINPTACNHIIYLLPCFVLSHLPWPHTSSMNKVLLPLTHPINLWFDRGHVLKVQMD